VIQTVILCPFCNHRPLSKSRRYAARTCGDPQCKQSLYTEYQREYRRKRYNEDPEFRAHVKARNLKQYNDNIDGCRDRQLLKFRERHNLKRDARESQQQELAKQIAKNVYNYF
jgi:hypothetical protein